MNRPATVVEIEITSPNSESTAIKDPEFAALLADNWRVVAFWIKSTGGDPGESTRTFMVFVLAPPLEGVVAPTSPRSHLLLSAAKGAVQGLLLGVVWGIVAVTLGWMI